MRHSRRDGRQEPLQVVVTGRNMPVSEALREYVTGKVGRLDRYLDAVSNIHVVLAAEHSREASRRNVAEGSAFAHGRNIRAENADADMYAAIDGLVDKLHHQLSKLKERTRIRKGHGVTAGDISSEPLEAGSSDEDMGAEAPGASVADSIVRIKQFVMKPMFSDEAISDLEELGHAFYVFQNAETEQVNVVYRRHGGGYGLIEPAFG